MAKQELNLLKFSSCSMTQPSTGTPEIMRCQFFNTCGSCPLPYHPPDKLFAYLRTPDISCSADTPKDNSLLDPGSSEPLIQNCLDPAWNRYRSNMATLPGQVDNRPVFVSLLEVVHRQSRQLRTSQTATEQQLEHRVVALVSD
jgi:hypothetical protein